MAKDLDKPSARSLLTGTAQSVTNSVERARGYLKDRPEPSRPPSQRENVRARKPEAAEPDQPASEPQPNKAEDED